MHISCAPKMALVATIAFSLSGCAGLLKSAGLNPVQGPVPNAPTEKQDAALQAQTDISINAYYHSVDPTSRASLRNQIIYGQMDASDQTFNALEWEVWGADAGVATLSDWAVLLLTGIASVNGAAATSLAAAASGITGARLSLQKNFLYNQTVSSLLVSMEINRAQLRSHIMSCLAQTDDAYPLYVAQYDAAQYKNSAVLPSAVARLTATSVVAGSNAPGCTGGGGNTIASISDEIRSRVGNAKNSDILAWELVMKDIGLTPGTPSNLSKDQTALNNWLNNARDQDILAIHASIQRRMGPASGTKTSPSTQVKDAVTNLPSSIEPAEIETAMTAVGLTPAVPGNGDRDREQIRIWSMNPAVESTKLTALAKSLNGLSPPPQFAAQPPPQQPQPAAPPDPVETRKAITARLAKLEDAHISQLETVMAANGITKTGKLADDRQTIMEWLLNTATVAAAQKFNDDLAKALL